MPENNEEIKPEVKIPSSSFLIKKRSDTIHVSNFIGNVSTT